MNFGCGLHQMARINASVLSVLGVSSSLYCMSKLFVQYKYRAMLQNGCCAALNPDFFEWASERPAVSGRRVMSEWDVINMLL